VTISLLTVQCTRRYSDLRTYLRRAPRPQSGQRRACSWYATPTTTTRTFSGGWRSRGTWLSSHPLALFKPKKQMPWKIWDGFFKPGGPASSMMQDLGVVYEGSSIVRSSTRVPPRPHFNLRKRVDTDPQPSTIPTPTSRKTSAPRLNISDPKIQEALGKAWDKCKYGLELDSTCSSVNIALTAAHQRMQRQTCNCGAATDTPCPRKIYRKCSICEKVKTTVCKTGACKTAIAEAGGIWVSGYQGRLELIIDVSAVGAQ
jgi:hypothetical protein